jgi:hypothetical protein
MPSKTEIANLALNHLAHSKAIANIELDGTNEARAIRRVFDLALEQTLREFPWPFATKQVQAAKIADDPTTEWAVSYGYPSDALFLRRILSGRRMDTRQSAQSYVVVRGTAGQEIHTDCEEAVLQYTVRETDPNRYPPDFTMAFSYRIAWLIAPVLTKGDPFRLQDRVFSLYRREIAMASAAAFNEEQRDEQPFSEFSRERDGFQFPGGTRQSFNDFVAP